MSYTLKKIEKADDPKKKLQAIFFNNKTKKEKKVSFGASGYDDYTKHKDPERKQRYLDRHRKNENWNDLTSRGALSRWILWNKPSLKESINDYKKKFNKNK